MMSSTPSSLSFALGPIQQPAARYPNHRNAAPALPPAAPMQHPLPPPPHKPYTASQSNAFFEDFLARNTVEINRPAPVVNHPRPAAMPPPPRTPPPKVARSNPQVVDSPDPLALKSSPVKKVTVAVTPQKRKPVVEIQQSPAKRIQAYKPLQSILKTPNSALAFPRTPATSVPLTPSTTRTNATDRLPVSPTKTAGSQTPSRIVNRAYVFVPPSPFSTPSSRKGHRVPDTDTPDLGGYGSEDPLASPVRRRALTDSVHKGSARRTGDRDERGEPFWYVRKF
jgi:cohesin loading factor subunit SCC2